MVLIALQRHPDELPVHTSAWYAKPQATFSDALAAARGALWPLDQLTESPADPDHVLFPRAWLPTLRQIVLYGG